MASSEKQTIVAQLVAPPPDLTGIAHPQGADLTPTQETAAAAVIAHFSAEGYALPGAADGAGALREEEQFWLVRVPHRAWRPTGVLSRGADV